MCQCHKVNTYAVAVGFMSQPSFYTNLSSALRKYLIKETETKKKHRMLHEKFIMLMNLQNIR